MYVAEGSKIYFLNPEKSPEDQKELFITVHPTTSNIPPGRQAGIIANLLNTQLGWV